MPPCSPGRVVVQRSYWVDPSLNCFSGSVEMVGLVEDGSLNTSTAVMAHDNDVTNSEFGHTVREDGDGVEVFTNVLVRDVTFSEEDARWGREDSPFRNSGVAVGEIGF
jgi:hypothetical protein